ncbi:MAG: hypothetical protein C0434_07300 [Xanthomonadaceae bacterium]|nr:hypothetical protein [Xanthomonadaceae bacterium]
MNLDVMKNQYKGTTLGKLIKDHIEKQSADAIRRAMVGTWDTFDLATRPEIDRLTGSLAEFVFAKKKIHEDLGDVFSGLIEIITNQLSVKGIRLTPSQTFDVFNIIVLLLAHAAATQPEIKKKLGIKTGWF